jgi:pilus biogenesis lipoprotein CpaD
MYMMNKKILLIVSILILSSSCKHRYDFREEHPITVYENEVTLALKTDGVDDVEAAKKLRDSVDDYLKKGDGYINIFVPFALGQKDVAYNKANEIAEKIENLGVNSSKIVINLSPIDNRTTKMKSPYVKFTLYGVELPQCVNWESNSSNLPVANFGCSIQRNVGLMVENPKDLLEARKADARSGARGALIVEKYEEGVETNSLSHVDASLINTEEN